MMAHEISGPVGGSISTEALSQVEALRVLYEGPASGFTVAPMPVIRDTPAAPARKQRRRRKKRRKAWKGRG